MKQQTQSPLFTQFVIHNLTLPNRVIMAPMTRTQSPGNVPSAEVARYYRRRAEGGTGLIITECTFINHPVANGFMDAPAFNGSVALAAWKHVVKEVHSAGGKIIPQIWHAGASRLQGTSPNSNMPAIGPIDQYTAGKLTVKGMTKQDIKDVIIAFTQAALDAQSLGFDGVEIHGAHSYLIDQFLWEQSNQRTDEYGGNLQNRVRFAREIIQSIRAAVGNDFPILFRFSQWKLTDYNAQIVQSAQELEQLLIPLAEAGVDIFHVSTRRFWEPAFKESEHTLAGLTKKITGKPVIAVGNVGIDSEFSLELFSGNKHQSQPASVERVEQGLQNNEFDLIAVGRALLADPDWAQKIRTGKLNQVNAFSTESLATLS